MRGAMAFFGGILCLPMFFLGCSELNARWRWEARCGEWLSSAANANTIDIAKDRLDKAIGYLEANNLTKGSSHWLWETPNTNIEVWYENLKAAQKELLDSPKNTSKLEQSNVLLKLRETLTDSNKGGSFVVAPAGIYLHPRHAEYCWGVCISAVLLFVGSVMFFVSLKG